MTQNTDLHALLDAATDSDPSERVAGDSPQHAIDLSAPAYQNAAVAVCAIAWQIKFNAIRPQVKLEYTATRAASQAYRQAMPALSGCASICDFIACVAHGMLIGALDHEDSGKLLYAAQVAMSAEIKGKPARSAL